MHCIKPSRAIIPHGDGAGCCPQPSPAPGHPRCQQCQLDNCATQTVSDPPVCNEYVSTAFNVPTFLCVCFINIYIYIFVTNYKYIFNTKHQIFLLRDTSRAWLLLAPDEEGDGTINNTNDVAADFIETFSSPVLKSYILDISI